MYLNTFSFCINLRISNLKELGNQVINAILYQAENKKIELLLNIDNNLPQFIWIDELIETSAN